MFVRPAPGMKVRDPDSRLPLPAEGREVPESSYWVRKIRSGDVVLADPAAPGRRVTERLPPPEVETSAKAPDAAPASADRKETRR